MFLKKKPLLGKDKNRGNKNRDENVREKRIGENVGTIHIGNYFPRSNRYF